MRRLVEWWSARAAAARWGLVLAEMALLWWTSSQQLDGGGAGLLRSLLHNCAHVVAYGAMGALALIARRGRRPARGSDVFVAVALAMAYGAVDELHQRFVPGRSCSLADLGADTFGAALGAALVDLATGVGSRAWLRIAGSTIAAAAAVCCATFTDW